MEDPLLLDPSLTAIKAACQDPSSKQLLEQGLPWYVWGELDGIINACWTNDLSTPLWETHLGRPQRPVPQPQERTVFLQSQSRRLEQQQSEAPAEQRVACYTTCQHVLGCIAGLNLELQGPSPYERVFMEVRETILRWAEANAEALKQPLREAKTKSSSKNSPASREASFAVNCLYAISQALVEAAPFVLQDMRGRLRALECQMIILSHCSEVIEWCNDWYVWSRWQQACTNPSRQAAIAPRRHSPSDVSSIQEAYQMRASVRARAVEEFQSQVSAVLHKHALGVPTDAAAAWAVPDREKNLLICQLWQSWSPGVGDALVWQLLQRELFGGQHELFEFVCRKLFGVDSPDPSSSAQRLQERHAALRYLLCDLEDFTEPLTLNEGQQMLQSHLDLFEKTGERLSRAFFLVDSCSGLTPSAHLDTEGVLFADCLKALRFEKLDATRVVSQLEGLSEDALLAAQQAVGGSPEAGSGASVELRRLAEELVSQGEMGKAGDLEALARRHEAAAQVKRFWELFRGLFYSGAPLSVVLALLPEPSSVLCFSLQPVDVLIAVDVLCRAGRVGAACAWVRRARAASVLSLSSLNQIRKQLGPDHTAPELLASIAMGMICQWTWQDSTQRSARLGMLIRVLRPEADVRKAIDGALSWEERTVLEFLEGVDQPGETLGHDLAVVVLFQRNRLTELLALKPSHHFRADTAEHTARAADAIMHNLDAVLPAPARGCVLAEAAAVPAPIGVPGEALSAMGMDLEAAVELAPPSAAPARETLQIGASPFGALAGARAPAQHGAPPEPVQALLGLPSVEVSSFTPEGSYLMPRGGPAVPTPTAQPNPSAMAHKQLLVALETPPPHSHFPRPDSVRGLDTPATPAFLAPATPITPSLEPSQQPQPSPALPRGLSAQGSHSRPRLSSRVQIRSRTPMSSSVGRASIAPVTPQPAAAAPAPEPVEQEVEMEQPEPDPEPLAIEYIPAEGQPGRASDPIKATGELAVQQEHLPLSQRAGLASAQQALHTGSRRTPSRTPVPFSSTLKNPSSAQGPGASMAGSPMQPPPSMQPSASPGAYTPSPFRGGAENLYDSFGGSTPMDSPMDESPMLLTPQ